MNLVLPFLFLKKGKGKISFENRKSISMKIQVMMKVINRLTIMNMKVTYLQKVLNDDETPVEQFIAPENDSEFAYPDNNVNFADSWILIWIFKYQARFRLSDVAIDSLIKFFQQLLMDADQTRFKDFPS